MELKPQGIVDNINTLSILKAQRSLDLANAKKELEDSPIYLLVKELEQEIRDIEKDDKELREQGKQILIDSGVKKFEALDGTTIQLNKKPGALIIEDDADIEDYKKEKITVSIDKKQLKEDIKEGVIIDGVYIKEDYSLVIKNK